MTVTLKDIEAARKVIAGRVLRTPMLAAPRLSAGAPSRRAQDGPPVRSRRGPRR